jgi:hypothetical protein
MVKWRYPAERDLVRVREVARGDPGGPLRGSARPRLADPRPPDLPDRDVPKLLERARQLHFEFWETGGPPKPA